MLSPGTIQELDRMMLDAESRKDAREDAARAWIKAGQAAEERAKLRTALFDAANMLVYLGAYDAARRAVMALKG